MTPEEYQEKEDKLKKMFAMSMAQIKEEFPNDIENQLKYGGCAIFAIAMFIANGNTNIALHILDHVAEMIKMVEKEEKGGVL